ncbi:MAG: hypothetical protein QM744_01855 [Mesorhizobium sp.]
MKLFSASFRKAVFAGFAVLAAIAASNVSPLTSGFIVEAQAKKIIIKQTNIYVATLPTGCIKTVYGNVVVWRCGTIYYQPYKGRYVRVYIN